MPNFALGRQPADPTKPKLRLRRSATQRPEPPASCDWLSAVGRWGMLANDSVGDCTAAGAAHIAMAVDRYGAQRDLVISDQDALAMYSAVSGYDPADPNTDVGATLQDALDFWRQTGIAGNTIAAAAQLDAQDLDLVRACIATFGAVYAGMSFPKSADDQFAAGETWTVVRRTRDLGGHCIPIGSYDETTFSCVTWGRVQPMTTDFLLRYVDEIWVPIDLDWIAARGASPAGLDIAALNADFEALTGQPGPFPPALPTPAPLPAPEGSVKAALVAAFEAWRAEEGL